MADELEIRGGGTLAVASEELFAHAEVHARLSDVVAELHAALDQVHRITIESGTAWNEVEAARYRLCTAQTISEWLPRVLHAAATAYGIADRASDGAWDAVNGTLAWLIGPVRLIGALAFSGATLYAGASVIGWLTGKTAEQVLIENPEWYTTPSFAGFVGNVAEHADEAALGSFGLPVMIAPLLGGAPGVARVLTTARPLGAFSETPVRVGRAIPLLPPAAPESLTAAAERIKSMETSGAQVIVERYELSDGSTVANVYIDGTKDWSPVASAEPLDMTSNVGGVAQNAHVGAAEAVKLAMRQSGIGADTPVQLFGYSQGGIQAALVAHQREFNVVSLVTIGSPVGDISLDPSIRALSVGHTEDLVFALGDDQVNPQTVQVTTERFTDDEAMPDLAAPGHQFKPYIQTLERIDASGAPQLTGTLAAVIGTPAGAVSSTSTAYRLERGAPGLCTP